MNTITWLHISDLHFKDEDKWNQNKVLDKLLDDVEERNSRDGLRPNCIFVTGDITCKGSSKGYELAGAFFDDLLKATGLGKERLFVVPGNHDVDQKAVTSGAKLIAKGIDDRDTINDIIASEEDRRTLFPKFQHYAKFVNDWFGSDMPFNDEKYYYVRPFPVAGKNVAILGLNSAILSLGDSKQDRLALGERQVDLALKEAKGADLRIALMHHPFECMLPFDREDCEATLLKQCDFILHGHLHQTGILGLKTPDAEGMVLAAGACYKHRKYPNACNWVRLDFDSGQGTVYLREYSGKGGGFWTKDVRTYRNVDDGWYPFKLGSKKTSKDKKKTRGGRTGVRPAKMDPALLEAAYLRHVVRSCKSLPLGIIDPRAMEQTRQQTMDLAPLYVSLNTTSQAVDEGESPKGKGKRGRPDESMIRDREPRVLGALEAAALERRMVLLGGPGSGKSTFVNYLALCLAGERLEKTGEWLARLGPAWTHGSLLPLRVTLREFAAGEFCDGTADGLWNFIIDSLAAHTLGDFEPVLRRRLLEGGVLVILDGLDGVPDPKRRWAVHDAVLGFSSVHAHEKNRYLVTCRGYAYQEAGWRLDDFREHTLAPLDEERIDRFITGWYEEIVRLGWKSPAEGKKLIEHLQTTIRRTDLSPLAGNPLQLTMMTSLHFSWGRLPDDRAELYQEMVRLLLVRWQEARLGQEVGVTRMVSPGDLESALERVAFVAHRAQEGADGPADVTEAQLRSVFQECLEGSWDKAGDLVAFIKDRAGLLIEKAPGVYTFPHRSYQEYLAGSYLAVQPDFPDRIAGLVRENYAQWREVALWAVAVTARLKKMTYIAADAASALCPCDEPRSDASPEIWRAASLSGEVLLEIGLREVEALDRHRSMVSRVRQWLQALLEQGKLRPRERVVTGNVLARLGDPRFRPEAFFLPADDMLGFVEIPAGPFLMGSDKKQDPSAYDDELPQHPVTLQGFYIGRYPVTVAQFRAFVEDSGYGPKYAEYIKGLDTHPVAYVTWHDTRAYCDWLTDRLRSWEGTPEPLAGLLRNGSGDGKPWRVILPSEAEWEKAARGKDGRIHPWGDEIDPDRANYDDTGIGATSPAGCFPAGAGPYGCLDMAGNVWEWTRSLWGKERGKPDFKYPYDPADRRRENLKAGDEISRVLRGGAFYYLVRLLRCAFRYRFVPGYRGRLTGFRVSLSPFFSEI
ncbi:MAG: SUMF1/EgtB/PvdO family nonheme iron enzyme [Proteobacteria bacterium]|nr:SUMF1/EgtB/PvdO family nonheme iron enzyme [Pseudomonadota bacterium]